MQLKKPMKPRKRRLNHLLKKTKMTPNKLKMEITIKLMLQLIPHLILQRPNKSSNKSLNLMHIKLK